MSARAVLAAAPWWARLPRITQLQQREVEWAVEDLLPMGSLCLIAGAFASFKSWLSRDLCRAIASGDQFAGFEVPTPRPALYLDRENSESQVATAWAAMNCDELSRPFFYYGLWVDLPRTKGALQPDSPELLEWSKANQGIIVFDTLVRFHGAKESDNSAMAVVMGRFLQLARSGSAVVVLHHKGKSKEQQFRGAEDIFAACDIAYTVDRTGGGSIELKQIKNRYAQEDAWALELRHGRFHRAGVI